MIINHFTRLVKGFDKKTAEIIFHTAGAHPPYPKTKRAPNRSPRRAVITHLYYLVKLVKQIFLCVAALHTL